MELAAMTLYKTVVMAVLALVGVFCYHQKMIDEELNKKLSDLVLMVFTPILLFTSFQTEYDRSLLKGLFVATVLSLVSFAVIWGISKLVIRAGDRTRIRHAWSTLRLCIQIADLLEFRWRRGFSGRKESCI